MNGPDEKFLRDLARAAEQQALQINKQKLDNTAWAFATVGQPDAQLFTALVKVTESHIDGFNPQDLANTALAFAKFAKARQ